MTRVILDPEVREKLHNLAVPLEICDESGRVLAHLTPAISPSQCERGQPEISREELIRRRQNKGKTSTTAEVLSYLETL